MDIRKKARPLKLLLPQRTQGKNRLLKIFLSLWALWQSLSVTAVAQDASLEDQLQKNKITVESFDKEGHLLHRGLGFVYDEQTVVCSYGAVRKASVIKVDLVGSKSYSNRLISYNKAFDLAFLKADEEMPVVASLGSSDMVAAGDNVYFLRPENREWQVVQASVKNFIDSGKGYDIIRLKPQQQTEAIAQPSPLYNSSGEVIGWMNQRSTGIPLLAIGLLLAEKNSSVSLSEINDASRICSLNEATQLSEPAAPELSELKTFHGSTAFPFKVDFPVDWKLFRSVSAKHYLLRALESNSGICVELRVLSQTTEDFLVAIDRAETLLDPGSSRSDLSPFSGDNFTGFQADYSDGDPASNFQTSAIYGMSNKNFYILAMRYPQKYGEQIKRLLDQIAASLRL